jgi:hypothetical protein
MTEAQVRNRSASPQINGLRCKLIVSPEKCRYCCKTIFGLRAQHTTCVEVKPQEVPAVPAINYRITDEAALTRYIETGRRYVASQDLCRACGLKTI